MKRKAKHRLEQNRKRGLLKQQLKLNNEQLAFKAEQLKLAKTEHEDAMIELWRNATKKQRVALEEIYQRTAGCSLRTVYEQHIIAMLQSQPRGVCDL